MVLNFPSTMVFPPSVTGQASSPVAPNGVIVDLVLITVPVTPVLTTGQGSRSKRTGLKENGELIAGVALTFLCLMEVVNQASATQTVRLNSAVQSGATVGVMKNTVDVLSVSTMPAEEAKVSLGQK